MTSRSDVVVRAAPVVVVGSGAAGLACALALAPAPVALLTKTALPDGGSSLLAQGGIAAALGPDDSPERHAADTLAAGDGLSDPQGAMDLAVDGIDALKAVIAAGLPVDREADGRLALGREAAHSQARIVHAGGDAVGRNLVATLLARTAATPSVTLSPGTLAVDLVVEGGRIAGLLACHRRWGWIFYRTPAVVLATGGLGVLWRETTNPAEATGDGLAMAARAGARLSDLEFMQFHPTALLPKDDTGGARLPLLTEALRGAGARLIDREGRPVMQDSHPLGDLAPRDAVARAIRRRRAAGDEVYLDLRPALAARGPSAFPQALSLCRDAGYDPVRAPVPVAPAAHYHMGGVATDACGRTSIPGLWACGEVAATGVHGANRLASNSLLEALVFAGRVAESLRRPARQTRPQAWAPARIVPPAVTRAREAIPPTRKRLRTIMSHHVGILRQGSGLAAAAETLQRLEARFDLPTGPPNRRDRTGFEDLRSWCELRNLLLAGRLIALAALRRAESRGAHFRSDVPRRRSDWARHQSLTAADLRPPPPEAQSAPAGTTEALT